MIGECVKAHMKVDAEKNVLEKTRNDQYNVEHGPETVNVLWKTSENQFSRALGGCMRTFCRADFFLGGVRAFGPSRLRRASASSAVRPRDCAGSTKLKDVLSNSSIS